MGLPQELINHIVNMIYDDLPALKACSLTCKAMFASTRHLIHQRLYLTAQNNSSILTREEETRYLKSHLTGDLELRFVSYMGECDLLQYTRQVYVFTSAVFAPDILLPHLHHFRSLTQVHSLSIERHYTSAVAHRNGWTII